MLFQERFVFPATSGLPVEPRERFQVGGGSGGKGRERVGRLCEPGDVILVDGAAELRKAGGWRGVDCVDAGESSLWTAPRCPSRARPSLVGAFNVGVGSSDLGFASCVHSSSRRLRAVCLGDRARVGIAFISLRRRGDEIRVTAARSRRVPSINFLFVAGRALPPRLPDTGFARRWSQHQCCPQS